MTARNSCPVCDGRYADALAIKRHNEAAARDGERSYVWRNQ